MILVVEDDDDLRESMQIILERRGFSVRAAANGEEALDSLEREGRPCLILLDLMMPVMDGWTFRSRILEDSRFADLPVVLLSGVSDLEAQQRHLDAVACLRKPVDLEAVQSLVRSHC